MLSRLLPRSSRTGTPMYSRLSFNCKCLQMQLLRGYATKKGKKGKSEPTKKQIMRIGGLSKKKKVLDGEESDPRDKALKLAVEVAPRTLPFKFSQSQAIRYDTIMEAWKIFDRNKRAEERAIMLNMYQKMQDACAALEKISPKIYDETMKNSRKHSKTLFPVEYHLPADTPPTKIWNYTFKK